HVIFRNEVNAGLGIAELHLCAFGRGAFLPGLERLAELGLHLRRIEVARDAEDDVVGMYALRVKVDQVLLIHGSDSPIFSLASVRIFCPISKSPSFEAGDIAN